MLPLWMIMDDVGCNDYWMMTCTDTIILLMVAKCIVESTADRSESIMDALIVSRSFFRDAAGRSVFIICQVKVALIDTA